MTDTAPEAPTRAWVQYDPPEDTGEVALPGYLDANPSIVRPGDVFSIDGSYVDEVTAGGSSSRFSETSEPTTPSTSANAKLNRAQLAEKLNADLPEGQEPYTGTEPKADLVALADDYDLTHPLPPSDQDTDTPEGETP